MSSFTETNSSQRLYYGACLGSFSEVYPRLHQLFPSPISIQTGEEAIAYLDYVTLGLEPEVYLNVSYEFDINLEIDVNTIKVHADLNDGSFHIHQETLVDSPAALSDWVQFRDLVRSQFPSLPAQPSIYSFSVPSLLS
jgi:hypothetical protein